MSARQALSTALLLAICCTDSKGTGSGAHGGTGGAGTTAGQAASAAAAGSPEGGAASTTMGGAGRGEENAAGVTSGAGLGGNAALAGTGGASASAGRAGSANAGGVGVPPEGAAGASGGDGSGDEELNVLVFTRTLGYRHTSIEPGVVAIESLGQARGWDVLASEAPDTFTDALLATFDVVVFLNTTGDVLDDAQQGAMERFIRAGNGYVGVHAASDTEYDWPWYGGLVGAYFRSHPAIQTAALVVEKPRHPSTAHLPSPWVREDEWYSFQRNPRAEVRVLLSIDETSYDPGDAPMGDHPIAWLHEYEGGRAFYTALGHTDATYAEAAFLQHLAGGIEWAASVTP